MTTKESLRAKLKEKLNKIYLRTAVQERDSVWHSSEEFLEEDAASIVAQVAEAVKGIEIAEFNDAWNTPYELGLCDGAKAFRESVLKLLTGEGE